MILLKLLFKPRYYVYLEKGINRKCVEAFYFLRNAIKAQKYGFKGMYDKSTIWDNKTKNWIESL